MARDVLFRGDLHDVLGSLLLGADRYHQDYARALVAVGAAFGVQLDAPPVAGDGVRRAELYTRMLWVLLDIPEEQRLPALRAAVEAGKRGHP